MSSKSARAALLIAAVLAVPFPAAAQMWRLEPDLSFSTFPIGWEPVDTATAAVDLIGLRNDGYLRVGYGFALDRDYYLLIPERESALRAFAGVDWINGAAAGFNPGGAAVTGDAARDFTRPYISLALDQILLGDRRMSSSWLMLSLSDVSRYVIPAAVAPEPAAPEAFFTHSPTLGLSFNLGRKKPFWELASLSGSLGATMEVGHSASLGLWSFLMADADLGFKFPILGKYLYGDAKGSLSALALNLTPAAALPAWAYLDYGSAAALSAEADLKSRVVELDFMFPMALELGAGVRAATSAADLFSLDPLAMKIFPRAFVDLAIDASTVFSAVRIRVGAEYNLETNGLSFILTLAN